VSVRVDAQQVRQVAALARLRLPEEEVEGLAAEMSRILDHVARLQALDTAGVPPTLAGVGVAGVTRPDEPRAPLGPEEPLANAPAAAGGLFLVPRVVEGGA
jgi:aspartyl-tRNA(Asn)/glutamyl-tRNA(Gln) amidotransferase subunit C